MHLLHRPLAKAIVNALHQIFGQNQHTESIVTHLLANNPLWGSRDRRLVAAAIYEIVRHPQFSDPDFAPLQLSAKKFKAFFAHNQAECWHLLGAWHILNDNSLPEWAEFAAINPGTVRQQYAQAQLQRNTRHSLPQYLDQYVSEQLGETTWEQELSALDQPASVFIRVNTLKTNAEQLINALAKNAIVALPLPDMPHTLRIEQRKNLSTCDAYRKGWFEIQDAGSQLIVPFCAAKPDMVVIDACAGAGGKTLQLAAQMNNKGTIVAMDTDKKKLALLEERAQRAGISIIRTRHLSNDKIIDRYRMAADCLLLDVPCSGLGTMRRQADLKWHLSPEKISDLCQQQADILSRYSHMLHPNGKLTYATCSILPCENEMQIQNFLQNNNQNSEKKAFKLLKQRQISPLQSGFDGFYMAQLSHQ